MIYYLLPKKLKGNIGMYQKLPARLILYKLTETQMNHSQKYLVSKEHKKQITYKERSKRLSAFSFSHYKYTIFTPYAGKLN